MLQYQGDKRRKERNRGCPKMRIMALNTGSVPPLLSLLNNYNQEICKPLPNCQRSNVKIYHTTFLSFFRSGERSPKKKVKHHKP